MSLVGSGATECGLLSPVNFSPMPHPENNNLVFFDIEYHTIIAYSEAVASQNRISQFFSMFERIFAVPEECFADPLTNREASALMSLSALQVGYR